mmetsp:Transcript_489/g.1149  ORF Transcript_489/g.1149 Transcript_489/m.1149 type:complete len:222 (-) Transcript_489:125-790(-)
MRSSPQEYVLTIQGLMLCSCTAPRPLPDRTLSPALSYASPPPSSIIMLTRRSRCTCFTCSWSDKYRSASADGDDTLNIRRCGCTPFTSASKPSRDTSWLAWRLRTPSTTRAVSCFGTCRCSTTMNVSLTNSSSSGLRAREAPPALCLVKERGCWCIVSGVLLLPVLLLVLPALSRPWLANDMSPLLLTYAWSKVFPKNWKSKGNSKPMTSSSFITTENKDE